MKKWTLLICCTCLLCALACHPSKYAAPDAATSITKKRTWSGYYFDTIYFNLGPSIHHQIVDSSLTIGKVNDSTVNMPYLNMTMIYRLADSIAGFIRYDTGFPNHYEKSTLLYYYLADSIVFDYEQYYPIENPHKVTVHLRSYN